MNTHADHTLQNNSQAVATNLSKQPGSVEAVQEFADDRPEAITQRKLQEMVNNSDQVHQLRMIQEIANNAPARQGKVQLKTVSHLPAAAPVQRVVKFKQMTGEITTPTISQIIVWLSQSAINIKEGGGQYMGIANMINSGEDITFNWAYGQQEFMKALVDYLPCKKSGPFRYGWLAANPDGQCHLVVYAAGETDPVGYAKFTIDQPRAMSKPKKNEYYTKAHVLANAGKVAHLTHLYNNTLLRSGPNDIYNGFGTTMLTMCETMAKACGAKLMYLEAASSAVRTDPMTDEKSMQNSTGFYTKYGYTTDAEAAFHNWDIVEQEGKQMNLGEDLVPYVQKMLKNILEGMLSKSL